MSTIIKNAHRASWFLIFHHNSAGGYFSTSEQLSTCSTHKYSALGILEKFRINGEFEFLLEYPQIEGFNRFKQTSNPTKSSKVTGFVKKHLSWESCSFAGLALSSSSSTFIDGSPNADTWYYAIALYSKWGGGDIPGPFSEGVTITEVNLWVRVLLTITSLSLKKRSFNSYLMILLLAS